MELKVSHLKSHLAKIKKPQKENLNPLGAFTLDPSGKSIS
jgi:hypothetical protein